MKEGERGSRGAENGGAKIFRNSNPKIRARNTLNNDDVAQRYLGTVDAAAALTQLQRYWMARIAGRAGFRSGKARTDLLDRALRHLEATEVSLGHLGLIELGDLLAPASDGSIGTPPRMLGLKRTVDLAESHRHLIAGLRKSLALKRPGRAGRLRSADLPREAVARLLALWRVYRTEPPTQSKIGFGGLAEATLTVPELGWTAAVIRHAVAQELKVATSPPLAAPSTAEGRIVKAPIGRHRVLILDGGQGLALETARQAAIAGLDVVAVAEATSHRKALKAIPGVTVIKGSTDAATELAAKVEPGSLYAILWIDPVGTVTSGQSLGARLDAIATVRETFAPLLSTPASGGSFVIALPEAMPLTQSPAEIDWTRIGAASLRDMWRQFAAQSNQHGIGHGAQETPRDLSVPQHRVATARRLAQVMTRSPNQWNDRLYGSDGAPGPL